MKKGKTLLFFYCKESCCHSLKIIITRPGHVVVLTSSAILLLLKRHLTLLFIGFKFFFFFCYFIQFFLFFFALVLCVIFLLVLENINKFLLVRSSNKKELYKITTTFVGILNIRRGEKKLYVNKQRILKTGNTQSFSSCKRNNKKKHNKK